VISDDYDDDEMPMQVNPSKEQYEANIYEGIRLQLSTFVGECHEEMMVSTHKRNREMGEGKLKFEVSHQALEGCTDAVSSYRYSMVSVCVRVRVGNNNEQYSFGGDISQLIVKYKHKLAFSALTLLVGHQEEHLACKIE